MLEGISLNNLCNIVQHYGIENYIGFNKYRFWFYNLNQVRKHPAEVYRFRKNNIWEVCIDQEKLKIIEVETKTIRFCKNLVSEDNFR